MTRDELYRRLFQPIGAHASVKARADRVNRYRRRFVRFRTELEGMIPLYGHLIAVSHDMPRWGQGGEVTAWTADRFEEPGTTPPWVNAVLTLSEPPVWTDGATHYIALRRRDGSVAGPYAVEPVAGTGSGSS